MAKAKAKGSKSPARAPRGKDANPRKYKKKTSPLVIDKVEYVDYKDVDLLSRFMERAASSWLSSSALSPSRHRIRMSM